jgi:hypothetical protein
MHYVLDFVQILLAVEVPIINENNVFDSFFLDQEITCEKLTDGRRTLTHDKSSHGLWPGELKSIICI